MAGERHEDRRGRDEFLDADFLRAVLESSPSFIHVLYGPDFVFEYANRAYHRLVGRTELIGRPAFEAMPEAAEGGFPERIREVLVTGKPFHGSELPVTLARTPGGSPEVRLIDIVYQPMLNADGSCDRVVGHGTDVTEHVLARREAEKREHETGVRLLTTLSTAKMLSWEWHSNSTAIKFSGDTAMLAHFGASGLTAPLEILSDALQPDDRTRRTRLLEEANSRAGSWHSEFRLAQREGRSVWVEELGRVTIDPETGERQMVGLVWDITDRKIQEASLHEADQRKNEFLATLAHELRNPLAPIRNGLALIKVTASAEPRIAAVREMMERQMTHLVRLVDDLLEVSRITRGKVELRREKLLLGSVISSAVESVWSRSEEKAIRLETKVDGIIVLDADRDRLTQVFANLLSNALKFTPGGRTVTVSARPDPQAGEAIVCIRDSGCGIANEQLERIFDIFSQGPTHAAAGGLGIGLALVRQLVELHGGKVKAESGGVGHGSEFVVRLPIASSASTQAPASPEAHAPSAADLPAARSLDVVVVDDNVDAADSLAQAIGLRGHTVRVAYDGEAALAECETRLPDLMILDIGMPGLDGYEVAREVDARWPGPRRPTLAALTGWGQAEDKQRAADAGFQHHFTKPADFTQLLTILRL